MLNLSSIRFRALTLRVSHAASDIQTEWAADTASARTAQSFGDTTQPDPATIVAASPTSVVTQGVPHAIASASTFGNASAEDDNTCRSIAFITAGISLRCPRSLTFSLTSLSLIK